jgi:hypothetical protein
VSGKLVVALAGHCYELENITDHTGIATSLQALYLPSHLVAMHRSHSQM